MSGSVRLSIRLGKDGDGEVEAIAQRGSGLQIKAHSTDDDVVIVEIDLLPVVRGGEAVGDQSNSNHAIPDGYSGTAGVSDRHFVRVGYGDFGPLRVLSHDVSPYDWRLVNFGGYSQQPAILSQENMSALDPGVQQQSLEYLTWFNNQQGQQPSPFPDITETEA